MAFSKKMQNGALSKEQALQKLKHYCAYQERCHSEVVSKMYDLGVWKKDHDDLLSSLIQEDYLNEERFAIAFAGGKWRVKRWGRTRINHELRQRGVSPYCIKKAMKEIDPAEYESVLSRFATAKYASLKDDQWIVRKKRTMDYLIGKGFETELVRAVVDRL